jgi:hypothetical protein
MNTVWVVGSISGVLLIPVVRACVWYQRWDPLDFLKEGVDPGHYGAHRSANSLLLVDPAAGNCRQELPGMEKESHGSLLAEVQTQGLQHGAAVSAICRDHARVDSVCRTR